MNCSMVVLAVLLTLGICYGFECPKDVCKNADCSYAPTKQTCKGTLIANGSFCGCCNSCVEYIKEGGQCTALVEMGNGLLMRATCAPGLVCHQNKCQQIQVPPMLQLN